jgi:hypothetical protein
MNYTVITLCLFFYVQLWADSLVCHTVQKPGRLYAASIFQRPFLHLLNVYPDQNGSSYFLCDILTLTFSTKTHRTYIPYPSPEFLVTSCCLSRLPSCPETN